MRNLTHLEVTSNLISGADYGWGSHDEIGSTQTVYFDIQPGQTITGWTASLTEFSYISGYYIDNSIYSDYEDGILIRHMQPTYKITPFGVS